MGASTPYARSALDNMKISNRKSTEIIPRSINNRVMRAGETCQAQKLSVPSKSSQIPVISD
eukprot:scaffold25541_cov24-Prasinocladus_malaysianus.AAC.1